MIYKNINHYFIIFIKYYKFFYLKKIFSGTNSNNFFLKNFKIIFFFSILNNITLKKILNIYSIHFFLKKSTILNFFFNNILIYKKNFGKTLIFLNQLAFLKILIIKNIKKKIIINFFIFNFFYFKIKKNLLCKFIYKIKNKIFINDFFFIHNDLFKDNILFFGNLIISFIDYYNYINNDYILDFCTIINEFSYNKKNIFFCIIENNYKIRKKKYINNYFFKNFFLRIKKILKNKKTKNPFFYLKKKFYEI